MTPAWGIFGGGPGAPPVIDVQGPDLRSGALKRKATRVPADTLVRTLTGGGGGYGDPLARPAAEVLRDVREGYVSAAAAERDYGVVIDPGTLTVDEAATARRVAPWEPPPPRKPRGTAADPASIAPRCRRPIAAEGCSTLKAGFHQV